MPRETIVPPEAARQIAYTNTDYTATLRRVFEGVQSRDDLAALLSGQGGSVVLVNSGTITSSDANFIVTGFSTEYPLFWVDFDSMTVDESGLELWLRTRQDGNGSPDTGASDYAFTRWEEDVASQGNGDHDTADLAEDAIEMLTVAGDSGSSNQEMSGRVWLFNPMLATTQTFLRWTISWTSATDIRHSVGGGYRKDVHATDALYFHVAAGTSPVFDGGNYRLYGIKQ